MFVVHPKIAIKSKNWDWTRIVLTAFGLEMNWLLKSDHPRKLVSAPLLPSNIGYTPSLICPSPLLIKFHQFRTIFSYPMTRQKVAQYIILETYQHIISSTMNTWERTVKASALLITLMLSTNTYLHTLIQCTSFNL